MKHLKRILSTLLVAFTFLIFTGCDGFSVSFSGCQDFDFSFLEGCTSFFPEEDEDDGDGENVVQASNYTFEIVRKADSFYYPTVKGTVYLQRYPDEITFSFDDQVFQLEADTIKYDSKNLIYTITFEQEIVFNRITKGEHSTAISYSYAGEKIQLFTLDVETDDYITLNFYNPSTGEVESRLDCESNWIGPY